MKKLLSFLFLFSVLAGTIVSAEENVKVLPPVPEGCFSSEVYCNYWEVLEKNNPANPHGKRVIRINFFAQLDAFEYDSYHDIIGRFQDFPAWMDYTKNSDDIDMSYSVRLPSIIDTDGKTLHRHEAHYTVKGPRIIGGKVNVRELAMYKELEPFPGQLTTWSMRHDENYKLQGLKYKTGILSLSYNQEQEVYLAIVILDVVPEINILPKVAAPYIETGLLATFKGMFGIN